MNHSITQADREFYRQTAKAYYRESIKRLISPPKYARYTSSNKVDLFDVNGSFLLMGCPIYLVDMSATRTLRSGEMVVLDSVKFLKRVG